MAVLPSAGPWHACGNGECRCGTIWSKTDDHPVAIVENGEWGDGIKGTHNWQAYGSIAPETAKANARLIAAAPDLYEALNQILNDPKLQTGIGGNPNYVDRAISKARAALAKANG